MKLKPSQQTHVPTEQELKQKWFLVDVKGKTLGPIATKIANILRGKNKVFFTPQTDCGDYVVVINAKSVRLAGNKMDTKMYHWHTRYPGGFRTRTAREISETKPEKIIYDAVWGMLPRNKTRKHLMRKLHIFPEDTHNVKAQSPEPLKL
ncbi:MAG: 50S ribosomal protein L13 [Patescibacteria group bacterium]